MLMRGALLYGRVAEWTIAPVLKTGAPQGAGGSNPSPSAFFRDENPRVPGFVYGRRREAAGMAGAKRQPPQEQEHRAMLAASLPFPSSKGPGIGRHGLDHINHDVGR